MNKLALLAALTASILGCGPGGASSATNGTGGAGGAGSTTGAGGAAPGCLSCAMPMEVGSLQSGKLDEVSGIVASQGNPGLFYVHNDSGDTARFFAIDGAGATVATYDLAVTEAVDWEDLALGPCAAGRCVYLADTGDNLKARASYAIYRVAEPSTTKEATLLAEAFPFTYPDGPRDVEAVLVHPTTGVVTLVTKTFGSPELYELPALSTAGVSVVATKVGTITLPTEPALVTGGDVHPAGKGVLLRTYADAYFFPMADGDSVADALKGTACPVPLAVETQGEAIGWLQDGAGYLTVSEGKGETLHVVTCTPF